MLTLLLMIAGLAGCTIETSIPPESCDELDNDGDGEVDEGFDWDGDGYVPCATDARVQDCDDRDARVHPDALEDCDGLDDNCDGVVPPEERDVDMDGDLLCRGDCDDLDPFANLSDFDGDFATTCDAPVPDCDDFDPDVSPFVTDLCDGVDTNCDGVLDTSELDADGDGQRYCEGDCDDDDPTKNRLDLDGDGYTSCESDCDDADPNVNPGQPEACDGIDDDCDGVRLSSNGVDLEVDADGDGYLHCEADCDDQDPTRFTGNAESCDEVDNDCDGLVPDWEYDLDGDGERPAPCAADCDDGDPLVSSGDWDHDGFSPCDADPDCDDLAADVHPGAPTDACNGIDDDCDGGPDGAEDVDEDGDGRAACPETDCDDGDPTVYIGAPELCDGVDNACAGSVPVDETDDDGDGFTECGRKAAAGTWDCGDPGGTYMVDCDDANADAYPGHPETCADGVDSDCDGADDTWTIYVDADEDGAGGSSSLAESCEEERSGETACTAFGVDYDGDGAADVTWSVFGEDCDDYDPDAGPERVEVAANHVDDDCDGDVDEVE